MQRNMCIRSIVCLPFLLLAVAFAASQKPSTVNPSPESAAAEAYGRLPLSFEANEGQSDGRVKFLSRGSGYSLFLTGDEAVLALKRTGMRRRSASLAVRTGKFESDAVLRMRLMGANATAPVTGVEELPGKSNYFIGDRSKWRTDVPNYAKVKYANVYPGVDLVYYGNHRELEYDFVVQPGGDPEAIRLGFGADVHGKHAVLRVDKKGDLVVGSDGAEVVFRKPVVYQPATSYEAAAAQREMIDGKFVMTGAHQVRFQIAAYDRSRPLVIDPTLAYSTYLGGGGFDGGTGIAVDASGNAYVTGTTGSSNFPITSGAFQTTYGGGDDAFVSKLNAAGSALIYSTYLGGSSFDAGNGIAVDASGNAYVIGSTGSSDFPVTPGAFQTILKGSSNAFVSKLNAAGSALLYSTYLGGSRDDSGDGIAIDVSGNAYVTGAAISSNFPTTVGAFQTASKGANAFVSKLNAAGSALVYSTYLGGSVQDTGTGIAIDGSGNAYVMGPTLSSDFPTTPGSFQTVFGGGNADIFVSKLNAAGSALVYSTYLGGSGEEFGGGIEVDASSNAYVTGQTNSSNFPTTPGAFQTTSGGGGDVFVSKLNAAGSALVYSTYLGGSSIDEGRGIAVDTSGNAYVTGATFSTNFPITPDAFQTTCSACGPGITAVIFSKLNAAGSALLYSTYLGGGGGNDGSSGIAINASGSAFVIGTTTSANFPTTPGAFQTTFGGNSNAFVSKFSFGIPFCSFKSKLELDADGDRDDGFELGARFALGTGGSINPATEPVMLAIGSYSVTIPAGSFVKRDEGYRFEGVINGVRLTVLIRREGGRGDYEDDNDEKGNRCTTAMYMVRATGKGAKLKGTTNPVTVTISIGDNTGTAQVHADFER